MNVLSIFDGMSCGQIALERSDIPVTNYFSSEIDKCAIKVTQANYPETQQLGCVTNHYEWDLPKIDLVIGGSPCQGFSFAGKQLNFDDPRSKLFFDFVEVLHRFQPKYFLLENVKMKQEYQDIITRMLGVEPILINSALVSAQNRKRLYWTNIPDIEQPEDKGILLKDIIENCDFNPALNMRPRGNNKGGLRAIDGKTPSLSSSSWEDNFHLVDRDKSHCIDANYYKGGNLKSYFEKHRRQLVFSKDGLCHVGDADLKGNDSIKRVYSAEGKSPTLTTMGGGHREPKILCNATPAFNEWFKDTKDYGGSKKEYNELYNGASMVGRKINPDTGKRDDYNKNLTTKQYVEINENPDKSRCLSTVQKDTLLSNKKSGRHFPETLKYRKLTPLECERLQTLDDNYTNHVSNTQRYKMIGNGWTVDVIAHIFKSLPVYCGIENQFIVDE